MRWLGIAKKGQPADEYAVGLVSHTVAKALIYGKPVYDAWSLHSKPAKHLGTFQSVAEAQLVCEREASHGNA